MSTQTEPGAIEPSSMPASVKFWNRPSLVPPEQRLLVPYIARSLGLIPLQASLNFVLIIISSLLDM